MAFAMGGWCRDLQPAGVINGIPGNHVELADQTGTTATQTLASAGKFFRAVVYIKGYTAGGSTTFWLQASDSATFAATSTQNIGGKTISGSAGSYSFIIEGFAPNASDGGLSYSRLLVMPASGYTYDCILDAL